MKYLSKLVIVFICCCPQVYAELVMESQQYLIDENSVNNTLVGQVVAKGGLASSSLHIDVGTQELSNWSTRGEGYEAVAFSSSFDSPPIVFRQIQSSA